MASDNFHPLSTAAVPQHTHGSSAEGGAAIYRENGDGTRSVTLKFPVVLEYGNSQGSRKETISSLNIRRLNGKVMRDLLRCKGDEEKALLVLFTQLTGQPEAVFDLLDIEDIAGFSEA
ncbi:MAG: hypothetical protein FJX23_10865, partial [Alphaproteobacteria bacterium]|nr:hypothetical protein [Alphaproteobacteria bacterium]